MLVFSSAKRFLGLVCPFLTNEPLQLSLLDKSFYLLLQVIVVGCIMTVIMVEPIVLFSRPFARVSLQLAKECQGSCVLDLHQDLINQGVQRCEACESSGGRLRASIFLSFSCP